MTLPVSWDLAGHVALVSGAGWGRIATGQVIAVDGGNNVGEERIP